ncbi:MAG: ABC transporter ATP-binding protein [Candidatus Riflemargulisbacteria bacterium]
MERSPRFPHPLYGEGFKKLSVRQLSFSLGKKPIFSDLNVEIAKNDICLVIGENGIGKSTFLKLLNKQVSGYSGEIFLDARELKEYSNRELTNKMSYLPQKIVFNTPYTVFELLEMSRYSSKDVSQDVIFEALTIFQIEHLGKKFITQLSGGEMQRVLLASTYIVGGDLMLLDEPFSFLDPGQRQKVFENILFLHEQQKRTFVMVVNSIEEMLMFKNVERLNLYVINNQKFFHFKGFDKDFKKLFEDTFSVNIGKRTNA